eukprot:COSAG05_NODE_15800_length_361_cov_0.450382_1_plen_51_part_00
MYLPPTQVRDGEFEDEWAAPIEPQEEKEGAGLGFAADAEAPVAAGDDDAP